MRFCRSSTEGSCCSSSSGKVLVTLYSLTPIGLLMSFNEYSATKSFFAFTKQQTDRRIVCFFFQNTIHRREIKIQLPGILPVEFSSFQFYHHIAAKIQIVEKQINVEIVAAHIQVVLIPQKAKPVPKFTNRSLVTSCTSARSISRSTISSLKGMKSKI